MEVVFEHWTDKEIRDLLRRLNRVEYGLILRFKNPEDMEYFKRKVYKLKVEEKLQGKVTTRISDTDPKHELWLLKVTAEKKEKSNGGEEQPTAKEVHDKTD